MIIFKFGDYNRFYIVSIELHPPIEKKGHVTFGLVWLEYPANEVLITWGHPVHFSV